MCSSKRSTSTTTASDRAGDLFDLVGLDDVAVLHVLEVVETDAALEAVANLAHVVLEPTERTDLAVINDDAVANQACLGVALDRAAPHVRPGDQTQLWHAERLADLRLAENPLALFGLQQAR